jgi:hypothetical protein
MNPKHVHEFWDRLLDAQEATVETLASGDRAVHVITLLLAAIVVINLANLILRLIGLV